MVNIFKAFDLHKRGKEENRSNTTENEHQKSLMDEIRDVCAQMENVNNWFQMENDSDLIEACIHQREVLNARYRYLINKIKLEKVS